MPQLTGGGGAGGAGWRPPPSQVTTTSSNKGAGANIGGNTGSGFQWWNPLDWFGAAAGAAGNWLGGLGGDIASGMEGGIIAIFKDLWNIILPWLEIIVGAVIIMWALTIYFRSQIFSVVKFAAAAV